MKTHGNRLLAPLALAVVLSAACGGDGGGSPTEPTGPQTLNVTGTTVANNATSCGGDSHAFQAGAGTVTVRLTQSTGGTDLMVQVCAGVVDNNDCTVNQQRIAVGQNVSGARKGSTAQTLKFLPLNCGGGGPVPPGPVQYAATVTYAGP